MVSEVYREYRTNQVSKLEQGYLCLPCNRTISHSGHVKRHFENIHAVQDAIYSCPQCRRRFFTKNSFQSHVYKTHPELKHILVEIDKFKTPIFCN